MEVMQMKVIVAGSRHFTGGDAEVWIHDRLHEFAAELDINEVVHGGCRGVDEIAGRWAKSKGIPCRVFRADWGLYGRYAGPRRNGEMAAYADALIAFPHAEGRGTQDMIRQAEQRGLEIVIWEPTR